MELFSPDCLTHSPHPTQSIAVKWHRLLLHTGSLTPPTHRSFSQLQLPRLSSPILLPPLVFSVLSQHMLWLVITLTFPKRKLVVPPLLNRRSSPITSLPRMLMVSSLLIIIPNSTTPGVFKHHLFFVKFLLNKCGNFGNRISAAKYWDLHKFLTTHKFAHLLK